MNNKNKLTMELQDRSVEQNSTQSFLRQNIIYLISVVGLITLPFLYYFKLVEENTLLILFSLSLSVSLLGVSFFNKKKDELEIDGVVKNEKGNDYFLNLGYFVKEHSKEGAAKDATKENILSPILVSEELFRTHMSIIGTTGSGKTVMAKSMMRQIVRDIGSGFIFIEGKGDNGMLLEVYAEMVLAKREHDYYVLNFLDRHNSNTINPLEIGDYDSVRDLILDFIMGGGDNSDTWAQGGKELMEAVLKPLIYLRDADLVWEPIHSKDINSIEDIHKYRDTASIPVLKDIINSPASIFEFALALSRLYQKDLRFKDEVRTYHLKDGEEFDNEAKINQIHGGLIDVLLRQTQEIADWEKAISIGSFEEIEKGMESAEDSLYKINISTSFYGEMFSLFLETFGEIFAVREGDINLEDIMENGKVLQVLLQGINPSQANSLGKFILSLIRMVSKRRAKKNPLRFPYPIFCDEVNSWTKGVEGFADLMSVTRSYGLSFVLMYQSDLEKIDDGKSIESGQIKANTNITYILKVNDEKILKSVIESLPKKKVIRKNLSTTQNAKEDESIKNDYQEYEEDLLKMEDFKNLQSGQGYVIINGVPHKCISTYIPDNTRFEINQEMGIPINKMIKK